MRFSSLALLPLAVAACVAPGIGQSNGAKMGEALAFAAAAGAAQVAESVAEQNARNNAPVTHPSNLGIAQPCDNQSQYPCVSVAPGDGETAAPPPPMSDADARDYVLGYVNGVRKLNAVPLLERTTDLDDFAQAGSESLALDHRPMQHWMDHVRELGVRGTEVQGSPDGAAPGPLQDQLADMMLRWTAEGPGGVHHDAMLASAWHKLGVGIYAVAGRTYFTIDFTE